MRLWRIRIVMHEMKREYLARDSKELGSLADSVTHNWLVRFLFSRLALQTLCRLMDVVAPDSVSESGCFLAHWAIPLPGFERSRRR